MTLHLTFKPSGAANFDLEIESAATISEVKAKCADLCGIDKDSQKIIFKGSQYLFLVMQCFLGRILKDEETLAQHGVQSGNVLHLVKGAKPGQPTDTPAATTTPAAVPKAAGTAPAGAPISPPAQPLPGAPQGVPNMGNLFGQMPSQGMGGGMGMDPQMMAHLMQTPMFQQMMTAMTQNPQMMAQMMQMNPMVQQMAQQNPQVAMLLQNPQLMQQLMNPQTIHAMMHMQQVMSGMQQAQGQGGPTQPAAAPAGGAQDYAGMMAALQGNPMLAQMLAGGAGAGSVLPPAAMAEFEQRYASEIAQLEAMGFTDRASNIEALRVCDGNVELAINYLFDLASGGN
jgi:ubiquilin